MVVVVRRVCLSALRWAADIWRLCVSDRERERESFLPRLRGLPACAWSQRGKRGKEGEKCHWCGAAYQGGRNARKPPPATSDKYHQVARLYTHLHARHCYRIWLLLHTWQIWSCDKREPSARSSPGALCTTQVCMRESAHQLVNASQRASLAGGRAVDQRDQRWPGKIVNGGSAPADKDTQMHSRADRHLGSPSEQKGQCVQASAHTRLAIAWAIARELWRGLTSEHGNLSASSSERSCALPCAQLRMLMLPSERSLTSGGRDYGNALVRLVSRVPVMCVCVCVCASTPSCLHVQACVSCTGYPTLLLVLLRIIRTRNIDHTRRQRMERPPA